jgi:hypothetical protein
MDDERDRLLALLAAADDPVGVERPEGDSWRSFKKRMKRFEKLGAAMQVAVDPDCEPKTWPAVQDTTFIGEVWLPPHLTDEPQQVLVSNFGDFAAMSDRADTVSPETLARIQAVLREHGYVWMPGDVIDLPYTGSNPYGRYGGFRTWRDRFFEYS